MQFVCLHHSRYFVSFVGNRSALRIEPKQEMFLLQRKKLIHIVCRGSKILHYSTRNMIWDLLIHYW